MSHFSTLVFLPEHIDHTSRESIEEYLEDVLEPYSENKEVEPYDEKCYCVGVKAKNEAMEFASSIHGTIADHRERFKLITPKIEQDIKQKLLLENKPNEFHDKFEEAMKKEWIAFIEDFQKTENEYLENNPYKDMPDLECQECMGTGSRRSTYNPNSKWDWYTIGGRWTGGLTDYDPTKDERNISVCDLCNGTGERENWVEWEVDPRDASKFNKALFQIKRESTIGELKVLANKIAVLAEEFKAKKIYTDSQSEYCKGCNGCMGTGKKVNWVLVPYAKDILLTKEIKADFQPFAFVDINGMWYEKAEMGWWAMTSNDKPENDWKEEFDKARNDYADMYAVIVDCHI